MASVVEGVLTKEGSSSWDVHSSWTIHVSKGASHFLHVYFVNAKDFSECFWTYLVLFSIEKEGEENRGDRIA